MLGHVGRGTHRSDHPSRHSDRVPRQTRRQSTAPSRVRQDRTGDLCSSRTHWTISVRSKIDRLHADRLATRTVPFPDQSVPELSRTLAHAAHAFKLTRERLNRSSSMRPLFFFYFVDLYLRLMLNDLNQSIESPLLTLSPVQW